MIKNLLSLESIEFQENDELYQDLIKSVEALRKDENTKKLRGKTFFTSTLVNKICEVMKKHTNITIKMISGDETGPAIYTPQLTGNHVFYDKEMIEMYMEYDSEFDPSKHINALIDSVGRRVVRGTIDLKKARVDGAFSKMPLEMCMPRMMLINDKEMSAEEVSAIMLHELGHGFTFMEFVSRSLTTNQSIAGLSRALDKSVTNEQREIIFEKASKKLELDAEKSKALKACKNEAQISVIVVEQSINKSYSELGYNLYDESSCEYLADQFAARQGASRALVTGLDKIYKQYNMMPKDVFFQQMMFWFYMFLTSMIFPPLTLIWIMVVVFGPSKHGQIYDTPKSRAMRVKLQNTERLKNPDLDEDVKKRLITENDDIEKIMKDYNDNLTLIERIAYVLRPAYRNSHKFELLQKDIEELASSNLFTDAARLKMV
jgi:hypothetical protein